MAHAIQINVQTGEQAVVEYTPDIPVQVNSVIIVSPRQIRQALTQVGLRDSVESIIGVSEQNLKDWWEYATQFESDHPQVIAMGQALSQSEEQIRTLFELARGL